MKVQLIRPPLDGWYSVSQITALESVDIGLCIIAARLRESGFEVSILDGYRLSLDQVLERIDGDVVGATDLYASHENTLRILETAHEQGAGTVIGGPNVTYLAERDLANHDFIDYAIAGDGERALPRLLGGSSPEAVPNLVWRDDTIIRRNPRKDVALDTLFDLDDISNPPVNVQDLTIPLSCIRGCVKAQRGRRCSFCTIRHGLVLMDPDLAWKQIRLLHERYGVSSFLGTGDTFIVGDYPEQLLRARPSDLQHIRFARVYVSPDQVSEAVADILRSLNVEYVFPGLETPEDDILRRARKRYRRVDIESAIDTLLRHGLLLHVPFMYGLPGETPETAERTFRFAEELVKRHPQIKVLSTFAVPLPGSELFEMIRLHPEAKSEYDGDLDRDDSFDYQALVRLLLKHFTSISYEKGLEMVEKTKGLVASEGSATSFDVGGQSQKRR